jgi:hypothetical protein
MSTLKFITPLYFLTLLLLFLYSFTQIDLSLTFSRIDFLREIVKSFQYVGYFNRPLSTFIYVFLLVFLFNFYLGFLVMAYTKKISKKFVWKLIIITTVILTFSYNAFSYDIFNYIFDAKIITHYQQNPYLHKALDFPGDPMLSFMRWTHRLYPYGPVWLGLTAPLSYLGFGFFLPTFFMFKLLMALGFLGSVKYLGKILQKISPDKEIFGLIFFGLNPLIIIESVVSGHLDITMIFFALFAFHLLLNKKYILSFLLLGISIGIKFATVLLLPIFILLVILQKTKKKINWNIIWVLTICLMAITVIPATIRSNFQPWYLALPLAFAAFLSFRYFIFIPSFVISFFAMLTYAPYLYTGNWDPPIPQMLSNMYVLSYVISLVMVVVFYFRRAKFKV